MQGERIKLMKFLTNFNIGGTERQFIQLVQQMNRERFDLNIGCFSRVGGFLPQVEKDGVPLGVFNIHRLYNPVTWRALWQFAQYLRKEQFDVVHSYGFYPNAFAVPAARLAGVPVVVASIRDTGEVLSAGKRRIQKAACRLATCVLANAEAVRERLVHDGYNPAKVQVIRNGIVPHRLERRENDGPLRRELGIAADIPIVAVLARLNGMKGVQYFLDALPAVLNRFPKTRFLVVGDGENRASLEYYAARIGLSRSVCFTGFRLDIPELLKEVSISVLPSLSEGLSNVLIESMAAGVPVIATRVGGNPELVQGGVNGILVPPRDAMALTRAITSLLQHRDVAERMGRCGREFIEKQLSLDRAVRETEQLYLSLLQKTGSLTLRESWT